MSPLVTSLQRAVLAQALHALSLLPQPSTLTLCSASTRALCARYVVQYILSSNTAAANCDALSPQHVHDVMLALIHDRDYEVRRVLLRAIADNAANRKALLYFFPSCGRFATP